MALPDTAGFTPPGPAPFGRAVVVTPNDDNLLGFVSGAIYVGDAGDVTVQMAGIEDGNPTLFAAVPAGTTLPICVTKVLDTGTDSTNIVAFW